MATTKTAMTAGQKAAETKRKKKTAIKALHTARWARIMTKWLVTHSSKDGVKWQVVSFNGKRGQESYGIVDMIAVRKNHKLSETNQHRGDLFEIVLIQVKGGSAEFPTQEDIDRLMAVKAHHRADRVVVTEWKKGEVLCCYELPDLENPITPSHIFGKVPSNEKVKAQAGP
jgi:hypothetical protein